MNDSYDMPFFFWQSIAVFGHVWRRRYVEKALILSDPGPWGHQFWAPAPQGIEFLSPGALGVPWEKNVIFLKIGLKTRFTKNRKIYLFGHLIL